MATLHLTAATTVADLRKEFNEAFGSQVKVYIGNKGADMSATLSQAGLTKSGEMDCANTMTVDTFIATCKNDWGLKVKVYTCDEWVAVLDALTLEQSGQVKKAATKADMEKMVGTENIIDNKKTLIKYTNLVEDVKNFLLTNAPYTTESPAEKILQNALHLYPTHDIYEGVSIKATLLNVFYSTGIQAIEQMAQNIHSIKNIDQIFEQKQYNSDLVNKIALLQFGEEKKERNNYSFATKYCAMHQPGKYPIYDSIVASVFTSLFKNGWLFPYSLKTHRQEESTLTKMSVGEFKTALRNYDFFVQVYDNFMMDYGLKQAEITYREVDWYLWASFKLGKVKTHIEEMVDIPKDSYYEWEESSTIPDKYINENRTINESALLEILKQEWKN